MNISQIKQLTKAAGGRFFSKDNMRFFDSIIYPHVYSGQKEENQHLHYFITSEQITLSSGTGPRRFTIRCFDESTCSITTTSRFQQYQWDDDAEKEAHRLAADTDEEEPPEEETQFP